MGRPVAAIVDLDQYPSAAVSQLETRFRITRIDARDSGELREALEKSQPLVLFCGLHHRLDREVLGNCRELSIIASPATGLVHLDLDYLRQRQIRVLTLLDCEGAIDGVFATAELAWLLVLALQRHVVAATSSVSQGVFRRDAFLGRSLHGRVLGIVGVGRLGRRVASYGVAFGMEVIGVDPTSKNVSAAASGLRMTGLDELIRHADVISLHVPLSKSTQGMIGRHELRAMRAGSMLVNTSRGEVIDEHATATSVVHGHLAGVGVDVLAGESEAGFDPRQSPLVRAQRDGFNVIVTPHIGGWTDSATARTRSALVARVLEVL